jgi:hypothetical protein
MTDRDQQSRITLLRQGYGVLGRSLFLFSVVSGEGAGWGAIEVLG